ncbi:SUN domain-containing ossification factor-like isoform X2 [Takifugu flavidus]|uniref:SUN domain-containing ossification factor-like isoform X2 n=1 Tax=Takifugu flavidus TaxID=433684 RepID=UPI0025446B53|nr:SUN domain-containing ossification factor-like isoform X2 [Takifugu flavidus]
MKMTPLLWRVVSVWLSVAVVFWCLSCYAGCTASHQEAHRTQASQDIDPQEESWEKAEESWASPALQASDDNHLIAEDQQREEQATQEEEEEEDEEPSLKVLGVEESVDNAQLETDGGPLQPEPEPEQILEDPPPQQDSPSRSPSHLRVSADAQDNLNSFDPQPDTPNSLSDEESDASGAEINDSDPPPANCEEENPYDRDSPPIVLENTSNVHTAGTKSQPDPPPSSPAAPSSQHRDANTSHNDLSSPVASDSDPTVSCKDPEDIPTFDEWKRKMMEVEKEKTQAVHTANSGASHVGKKVQKNFNNYASVECGAKILGSNPEAKSTSAILMENMDMYMLNPCSNKIWFIIELCEPVQVKQLDIANFELFSSTPKDFIVSISDRYPTNKWQKLGTFHARDERTVQSFPLDEHLYAKYVKMFAKYIKVELLSHFGSEHFCPLSLIRVFGTSMVEEYEEIADPPERPDDLDDDFDYPPGYTPEAKLSKNLIGSAKDAILNMVNNIAVNVLGGGAEMQGNVSSHDVNATEPSPKEPAAQNPPDDVPTVPESEVETSLPDPSIPTTIAPSSETPTTHRSDLEAPHVEEEPALPSEKDEEQPISSTITLLEKEEESDEEKGKGKWRYVKHQPGIPNHCSALPPLSSRCCCNASLQEYLHQRCSASLSKKRKCQAVRQKQTIPSIETPAWQRPLFPSGWHEPQQPHSEEHQPRETEQAAEPEPESSASPSEAPQPPENTAASHKDSILELPLLEPSQSSNLPKHSVPDSSSAKPTPGVETPLLSSGEPEKNQDAPAEERHIEPSVSPSGSSHAHPAVTVDESSVVSAEETFKTVVSQPDVNTPDRTDQILSPTASPFYPDLPIFQEADSVSTEGPGLVPDLGSEPEPSSGHPVITDTKTEEAPDDASVAASSAAAPPVSPAPPASPSLSDIYADPPNGTEQNGNQVHGSSQKESVFMRLNNRIKALEMNMSLSGRYLEQLSQRYRKQMEEMQKAFNKTVIKLQNTSRIAEEQDQRQTESIQLLQGQLENMTRLVLNLSDRVSQLQVEVSERQTYLVLSLVLCFCVGLLLCANHCRITAAPPSTEPEPPVGKSYSYCCPERQFSSCDEPGLKRSASYPLIHSESFQLATTEGPEMLHTEDTQSLCTANRKKRRRKMKPTEKVETLRPSFHAAPKLCNGGSLCNGVPVTSIPAPLTKRLLPPVFRDSPSEGSSEGSSHSDDPSFCGIATSCSRICDSVPPPKSRTEKRASRRRRPKPGCAVIDFLQAPKKDKGKLLQISTIEDIMKRTREQSSGTFGVNVALSGPV